jgi:hypothetical protein
LEKGLGAYTYGGLKFEAKGSALFDQMYVTANDCSTLLYDTNTVLRGAAMFVGVQGEANTKGACNDATRWGITIACSGSGDSDCSAAYGTDFAIYTRRIRRSIIVGAGAADMTWRSYGDSTDSNGEFACTAAADHVGSETQYTCTIPDGGTVSYAGYLVTVTGFMNGGNNIAIPAAVVSNTASTITIVNGSGVHETGATAYVTPGVITSTINHTSHLGSMIDIQGGNGGTAPAAIQNRIPLGFCEMGDAGDTTHSLTSHYDTCLREDYSSGLQSK